MSAELGTYDAGLVDAPLEYRALSTGAIVSLILGFASVFTLLTAPTSIQATLMMVPIPIAGLCFGIYAWLKIRQLPDELTGGRIAVAGMVLSVLFLVSGLGLASYVYATEVPDGYQRVAFTEMKPDEVQKLNNIVVPEEVMNLQGQRVFIKGYMRPPSQMYGLDSFLLVRDNGECCFGQNLPEYYDRVQIHLMPPLRTDYSTRMYRVAGTLEIDLSAVGHTDRPVFSLVADYLK